MLNDTDLVHLRRSAELAREAFDAGDDPFGSVLVGPDGVVLREERNRAGAGDETRHPEFELARWAAREVPATTRPGCTVYTSGEHCPMCAAAHAWVGLGRIVYAVSAAQLTGWRAGWGLAPGPVRVLAIDAVTIGIPVAGPAEELVEVMRGLHHQAALRSSPA
jgi:tRNA(Arg) A34 adenosine deaminase TadA